MMWTSPKLRRSFLDFFEERGHKVLPSSSVVPKDDPTLLFTNSGMVQFKSIFLGAPARYPRVCTVQRCIRAGGKHNDLEDVGRDNYHHTFFEMLGNWSFGDYFKADAIRYAYEFLVEHLGLDKENMYVTIYEEMDKESRKLWRRYLDDSRIIAASAKDNFWEMGDFGPCGPCTEIHYDRIGGRDASSLVNKDDPDVIEIWNIVFMEYNNTPEGLVPLEQKNIDTGIGMERLLSILTGADSNYKIDSFKSITDFIEENCNYNFEDTSSPTDVAFRVLADHSRTMAVCLSDGVAFSNVGVGYVLRRILRRAVRYAHEVLFIAQGTLAKIVQRAAETLELSIDTSAIDKEETLFLVTLDRGVKMLNKLIASNGSLTGKDVFVLYDTFGFPKDLTELIAREKNVSVSLDGFEECQRQAKELSKTKTGKTASARFDFETTDDVYKYSTNGIVAKLMAVVSEGSIVPREEATTQTAAVSLVYDKTCFYGEKGGQAGDQGRILMYDVDGPEAEVKGTFVVEDTKICNGYVYHVGKIVDGSLGKFGKLIFDEEKRARTRANHSTAHILFYYLREMLDGEAGRPCTLQQGQLVDHTKCRFDFNGPKLGPEMIRELERRVNDFIRANAKRNIRILSEEEAKLDADIHLEDEDYSDGVRVIEFSDGKTLIRDACSGTHVESTKEIQLVRFVTETSVKAGIRRIVALTREAAVEAEAKGEEMKRRALGGEDVVSDGQIPILTKHEISEIVSKNQEMQLKRAAEKTEELSAELRKDILHYKVKNMLKQDYFSKELSGLEDMSQKQAAKVAANVGKVLVAEGVSGILTCSTADSIICYIHSKDLSGAKSLLSEEFGPGRFKVSKNLISGTVKATEKDKLFSLLPKIVK